MNNKYYFLDYDEKKLLAIMEDGKIKDLIFDSPSDDFKVGSLIIGKVTRLVQGANACFVSVCPGSECYMNLDKTEEKIRPGDEVLVEVKKEASGIKKAVVTLNISFPGRFAIVMPKTKTRGVSSKITGKIRENLKELLSTLELPYGVILRTSAKDASEDEIKTEISRLIKTCNETMRISKNRTIYSVIRKNNSFVLDYLTGDEDEILLETKRTLVTLVMR